MLTVKPFRGLRFNAAKAGALDSVITPPYDVISDEERARLALQSPHNMVHVLLPEAAESKDKYAAAADAFGKWLDAGILQQDDSEQYYLLRQTFEDEDGQEQVRRGFFAATKIPEPGQRQILGHERTFDKPVEDRLRLTEATEANLGAVFVLYSDPAAELQAFLTQMDERPADIAATTIDGVRQELWVVAPDPRVAAFMQDRVLYIADGHHRFQTACAYREQRRKDTPGAPEQPYDYVLMGFVAFEDPGLLIYPPHRVVKTPQAIESGTLLKTLEQWFTVRPVEKDIAGAVAQAGGGCVIGMALPGGRHYLLELREEKRTELLGTDRGPAWRDLDVAVLHRGIIERILGLAEGTAFTYEKNAQKALAPLGQGNADVVFVLRATRAEQIRACAEAGEPMPQKSTYFFPKLPSGAVIHRLR